MMLMRNFALICLILFMAGCNKQPPPPLASHAIDVSWRYAQPPEFRLADAKGNMHSLSDFRGKVVVLFFGYTHCPEVCPTTLTDMARVMRILGPDAERTQVLFVTLDPERDTPAVLSAYVPFFHPLFMGLYGNAEETAAAAQAFAVNYEKHQEKHGYSIDHSDGTFLIGKDGKTILLSPYGQRPELVAEDIKLLLGLKRNY